MGLALCAFYRYSNAIPVNEGYFLSKRWHIIISVAWGYVFLLLPSFLAIYMSRVPIEDLKSILRKEVVTYVGKWGHDPLILPHSWKKFLNLGSKYRFELSSRPSAFRLRHQPQSLVLYFYHKCLHLEYYLSSSLLNFGYTTF